jgi:multiple sugar transport system ATP-binding protein
MPQQHLHRTLIRVVVEPMGNETHVSCRLGKDEIRLIEGADMNTQPGRTLGLAFEADKAHYFDKASGLRLGS